MNEIVIFEPEHLVSLVDIEGILGDRAFKQGESHKRSGPTATILVDGKVAACGGIHRFWAGTGEGWMSVSAEYVSASLLRAIRKCFDKWMEDYTRVQAITVTGWKEGERTMKFLGFTFEAVLRKMGPNGIDKSLYSRIR